MSAKAKTVSHKQLVEDSAFQLSCCSEFTGWMVSLMRAINLDHEHERGNGAKDLSGLGLYLAEAHKAEIERACKVIDSQILSLEGAV